MDSKNDTQDAIVIPQKTVYGTIPDKNTSESKEEDCKDKKKLTSSQLIILITLCFGNFCSSACASLQGPFFPAEAERKGATPTEYGLVFGLYHIAILLSSPIMGKLVAVISPKTILNVGMVTLATTCITFGTLDMIVDRSSFVGAAFVVRIIEGIACAALKTSSFTIAADQFPGRLGTVFAFLQACNGIGHVSGPTVGGALYDFGGYGLPFYVVGSAIFLDAVIIYFALPIVDKKKYDKKGSMVQFWIHPRTLLYVFCIFVTFNYMGFNQVALEQHLRQFELSGVIIGLLFAVSGATYALSAPGWGWLYDKKVNVLGIILVGTILALVSLLLIGPAPFIHTETTITLIIISLVLWGLGVSAKLVCGFSGCLHDTIERGYPADFATYGMVASMFAATQSLGSFIGPALGGYLLHIIGFKNSTLYYIGMEIVLVIVLIVAMLKNPSAKKSIDLTKRKKLKSSLSNAVKLTQIKRLKSFLSYTRMSSRKGYTPQINDTVPTGNDHELIGNDTVHAGTDVVTLTPQGPALVSTGNGLAENEGASETNDCEEIETKISK